MSQNIWRRLDVVQAAILILTLITALTHLFLGVQLYEELHSWFLLNGLGYLILLAAFFLPRFAQIHPAIRWMLLGYTLLTIILWFFLGSPREGKIDPFDMSVKGVEALLVLLLVADSRRDTNRLV
jgi:hypothetical protein